MGSRLLLSAAAVLVAFAIPVESRAESNQAEIHTRGVHHHHRYCCQHVGGYRNFIFGPNYWAPSLYEMLPPSAWSATRCYPGFYGCQTFWERVNTQRNYPVQY